MSDIQRYVASAQMYLAKDTDDADAGWISYADHVEALRQAEQRGRETLMRELWGGHRNGIDLYEQAQRDVLAAGKRVLTDDWYAVLESEVVGPHETAAKGDSDE